MWINPHARGHLQASGRDARRRKQYLYHADWRAARDESKYDNVADFARTLPRLRRALRASLRRVPFDRERVTALVIRLLETSLIRVGNDEYARTNQSFGLTTLKSRHAIVHGGHIRFTFRGKSGRHHDFEVAHPNLARMVRRLQDLPGQDLFCYLGADQRYHRIRSNDVNAYLHANTGAHFTAKDFRTWAGTMLAALTLAQLPVPATKSEAKRSYTAAVRAVAARLGNTAAIARRSYIHPRIPEAFRAGRMPVLPPAESWPSPVLRRGLAAEERAVLRLIEGRRSVPGCRPDR